MTRTSIANCLAALSLLTASPAAARTARIVISTAAEPWQEPREIKWKDISGSSGGAELLLLPGLTRQSVDGFGGCFNEKGWEALALLSPDDREAVLSELFDPSQGCRFNLARMPIGANDYSLDWYSYDETAEDYALEHFSIAHDRRYLIPYIKAALEHNPKLRVWASPWSPPQWMKTNGHYACAVGADNGLKPEQAGEELHTQFRMEPKVLAAYARYFARFLDAYKDAGITIGSVHVQNEPNSCQNFPSCVWAPGDLAKFIGEFLGPLFHTDRRDTEIWLGTIERPQVERVDEILKSPAGPFIHGVGFQWGGQDAIAEVHKRYPNLPLMQTESECGNGSNDWAAAVHTFELMKHYFDRGAGAYMYWNMVLDETGLSRWLWRQNALITVDRKTAKVRYNPEFYVLKHFSHFVRPGALALGITGPFQTALAFQNPDNSVVLVLANPDKDATLVRLSVGRKLLSIDLPARSFATVVTQLP